MTVRAKTPFRRTGFIALLHALLGVGGSSAPSRRPALLAVVLAAVLASLFALSGAAVAATGHTYEKSFGPDGTDTSQFQSPGAIGVDEVTGDVYVADLGAGTVRKFDASGIPTDFSALGTNEIGGFAFFQAEGCSQIAVDPVSHDFYVTDNVTGAVKAYQQNGEPADFTAGPGAGTNEIGGLGELCGVAVDSQGDIYASSFSQAAVNIYASDGEAVTSFHMTQATNVAVDSNGTVYVAPYHVGGEAVAKFAPSEYPPTASTTYAESRTKEKEPVFAIAVDPFTNDLYADRGDGIVQFGENGAELAEFAIAGPGAISGSEGIAINGGTKDAYVGDGGSSQVEIFSGFNRPVAGTGDASATSKDEATLNGTVEPGSLQLEECVFEYGPVTETGFGSEVPCSPAAADIPPEAPPQAVTGALTGLQPNATYRFRLTVTAGGAQASGEEVEFSTVGPPRITEVSSNADQGSATLDAMVDPRGAQTSYRIEWGPDGSYGNVAASGTISSGEGPTQVSAHVSGLSAATTYHWRVVASSAEGGETVSTDRVVETLDACGFTDDRCLELVSRIDRGPLASPGKLLLAGQAIQFQAAAGGSAFAYVVPYGYPGATAGDAAEYVGRRADGGWTSEQMSPPSAESSTSFDEELVGKSHFNVLSSELGCGVVSSAAPAAGAAATVVELFGGTNLYLRDNATGSYRLITYLPPVGLPVPGTVPAFTAAEYQVIGMSSDCERVVFRTGYRYPGIPAVSGAKFQLYEWDDGTLRNVAVVPGPGGSAEPVPAESLPGSLGSEETAVGRSGTTNYWRAVSANGSRSVFTAVSRFGGDEGRLAVFLGDAGDPAVRAGTAPATDISQSETATPNNGDSLYWIASADGARVFFTARYGLAANGTSSGLSSCANSPFGASGEGCDLYEYDAAAPVGERLTDLSPDMNDPKGAGVVGVLDASEDGSDVYFAARGRLGGAGHTEAQNLKTNTYNIYLAHAGILRFIHSIGQTEALGGNALIDTAVSRRWTSRATPDGESMVFESSVGVPRSVAMVYLYSAAEGTTVCVSCRHDGHAPFSEQRLNASLLGSEETNAENRNVQPTVLTANGRLYFYSFDPLAPGAVEGARNLYQWQRGQVSLIATEPVGVPRNEGTPSSAFFGGASADGGDVYFATPQRLASGAGEGWNVYDARVGGGFPEPTPPTPPCNATAEGACNPTGANSPGTTAPTTSTFTGPGNPPAKHHKKKHHKKKHHKKKHHKKAGKSRRADDNRGAAK